RFAWMLGFSSTLSTTAFNGGVKYNPPTSAAFGANSLSVLTHQTASPLQIDSFAAQNTPDGMNAGVELFRYRRPVPVGHSRRRCLLQHGQYPVAKRSAISDRLARPRL